MSSEDIILQFMQDQNRPFNVQNVTDHMQRHGIKKPTVQKALDELASKGRLVVKDYNKTKIYHSSQAELDVPSPEELQETALRTQQLQQEITEEKQVVAVLEKEVSLLMRCLTDEQITQRIQALQEECASLEAKLKPMRGTTNLVSKDDLQKTEKLFTKNFTEYRKRKRMFRSVWDTLLESSEKKPSALEDEVGVENDASSGVDGDQMQKVFDNIARSNKVNGTGLANKVARRS
mmetsp:Transcript_29686/g.64826  ORF Transcript_29686/g.64826 Transcript_29686/m.64826 type:complete len:234 (-) Transcript_29686:91-792(-)